MNEHTTHKTGDWKGTLFHSYLMEEKMKQNQKPDSEMLRLSRAITRALLKSEDVLSILTRLKGEQRLKEDALIAFVLKANDLLNISQKRRVADKHTLENKEPEEQPDLTAEQEVNTYIDGKKLTEKEVEFQEYMARKFNMNTWMKSNGLRF